MHGVIMCIMEVYHDDTCHDTLHVMIHIHHTCHDTHDTCIHAMIHVMCIMCIMEVHHDNNIYV